MKSCFLVNIKFVFFGVILHRSVRLFALASFFSFKVYKKSRPRDYHKHTERLAHPYSASEKVKAVDPHTLYPRPSEAVKYKIPREDAILKLSAFSEEDKRYENAYVPQRLI